MTGDSPTKVMIVYSGIMRVWVGALSCVCHTFQKEKKMRQAVESWLQKQATCSALGNQSNGKVIFLTNGVKAKREYCCYVRNSTGSRSNGAAWRKHSAGLRNNDAISIYIVRSIILLLSSSVVFFFFLFQTVCKISQPQPLNLAQHVGPHEWGATN